VVKVHKRTYAPCAVFFILQCTEKCIKSIGKSENVIFETMAEVYLFKVMHICISYL